MTTDEGLALNTALGAAQSLGQLGVGIATGNPMAIIGGATGSIKTIMQLIEAKRLKEQQQEEMAKENTRRANALKVSGTLLAKGGKTYRPGYFANTNMFSHLWTKDRPFLAQKGMKLQDFINRPSIDQENTLSSVPHNSINTDLVHATEFRTKSLPYRNIVPKIVQDGKQVAETIPAGRSFEKGGEICSCEEDGIDLDVFKKASPTIITIIRKRIGMGEGPYTERMKNNMKVRAGEKGMRLVDYLFEDEQVKNELQRLIEEEDKIHQKSLAGEDAPMRKSKVLLKKGGKVNKILDGVLHSRKNEIHTNKKLSKASITKKGIPVISEDGGQITQHAEVEKNEIVFSKENTDIIENYIERISSLEGEEKDQILIEFGKWLKDQLLKRTKDSKDKLLK